VGNFFTTQNFTFFNIFQHNTVCTKTHTTIKLQYTLVYN